MSFFKSFASAFLMYSRIPMPKVQWKEENRRYALCFFPLIGIVIGGLIFLEYFLCSIFNCSLVLFSAIAVIIPVIITGGIHIDGFMDVNDAKACLMDKEKRLEVMKDSRVGAFAVIHIALYLILQFSAFYEISYQLIKVNIEDDTFAFINALDEYRYILMLAMVFLVSRAYSGLAAVTFKSATGKGSLTSFTKPAYKKVTIGFELFYIILASGLMLAIDLKIGIITIAFSIASYIYYWRFSYKNFDGITGDLAGYFLQINELAQMLGIAIGLIWK